MEYQALLLQCVAHDYALHELKHATVLARRLVRDQAVQKDLIKLQMQILAEIDARKQADQLEDAAA